MSQTLHECKNGIQIPVSSALFIHWVLDPISNKELPLHHAVRDTVSLSLPLPENPSESEAGISISSRILYFQTHRLSSKDDFSPDPGRESRERKRFPKQNEMHFSRLNRRRVLSCSLKAFQLLSRTSFHHLDQTDCRFISITEQNAYSILTWNTGAGVHLLTGKMQSGNRISMHDSHPSLAFLCIVPVLLLNHWNDCRN